MKKNAVKTVFVIIEIILIALELVGAYFIYSFGEVMGALTFGLGNCSLNEACTKKGLNLLSDLRLSTILLLLILIFFQHLIMSEIRKAVNAHTN